MIYGQVGWQSLVECTGLENRRARYGSRGFESLPHRVFFPDRDFPWSGFLFVVGDGLSDNTLVCFRREWALR